MNLADVTHILYIAQQLKLKYPQFRRPYAPHADGDGPTRARSFFSFYSKKKVESAFQPL